MPAKANWQPRARLAVVPARRRRPAPSGLL